MAIAVVVSQCYSDESTTGESEGCMRDKRLWNGAPFRVEVRASIRDAARSLRLGRPVNGVPTA
jgi:hypothetical protein